MRFWSYVLWGPLCCTLWYIVNIFEEESKCSYTEIFEPQIEIYNTFTGLCKIWDLVFEEMINCANILCVHLQLLSRTQELTLDTTVYPIRKL